MRDPHDIETGDRVKFTAEAARTFQAADGRRRFTVERVEHEPGFAYWTCYLDDGSSWANQWLELVDA